ncbi:hypothetical protein FRACYDRAFT_181589 [Fragilariopsis cylindrus CCMP1102]|uniref:Uncharacterized protein n=1 Tax=Fragilariopsis cylindrus CCMP1102 TaxID=635003 RepID=A0A1E7FPI1_9STRA|nr:hypothetical protein FRACYDRAFT_181589 [Fragilariopsis cylindrus CCMP1102]|eukprot:OEU20068.1 hypothetical protein FRACYDRAFT_181589 [Fragilariopsis cylindrus CCMP1102]
MAPQQQHKQQHKQQEKKYTTTTGIVCQFCNKVFASKNLVFRHLRDASTTCGNTIIETGQKLPDAPSKIKKHKKKEIAKALRTSRRRKKTGQAKQNIDPASTLWFGDLPLPYTRMGGQYKRLRAVLKEYLPRDVPPPWIKKVIRKGYRKGGKKSIDEKERGDYYGYAIIVFRDAEEAKNVMTAMDGTVIESKMVFPSEPSIITPDFSTFVLKVNNVQHNNNDNDDANSSNNNNNNNYNKRDSVTTSGDQDPPLIDQLRPLSTPELQKRCQYMKDRLLKTGGKVFVPPARETSAEDNNSEDNNEKKKSENYTASQEHDKMLDLALSLYDAIGPRQERLYKGRVVPESIRDNLVHLLKSVRWPAESHRKGLTSDNYLVLQTNITKDRFYNDLRLGCRELMDWVDPNYYYSGIAVTKNFVASPHIDDRDQSFQYAVSLGEFNEGGGELCVEGNNNNNNGGGDDGDGDGRVDYVNVVETRNRIAKVDGRNVHWVRSWNGTADRYSLIFYDTTDRHQTDIINTGVDVTFLKEIK